ncbi:polycystin-1-like [Pleurodeles waltl]|uniref:polycystin-1-like n=1 Tax=Pleurodeles waltl TaxID=8319 RepID=UPI0037093E18
MSCLSTAQRPVFLRGLQSPGGRQSARHLILVLLVISFPGAVCRSEETRPDKTPPEAAADLLAAGYMGAVPPSLDPGARTRRPLSLPVSTGPGAPGHAGALPGSPRSGALHESRATGAARASGGQVLPVAPAGCRGAAGCDVSPEVAPEAGQAGEPCPSGCVCSSSTVNCSRVELMEVPTRESCPPGTVSLDLSHNQLKEVRARDFADFPELLVLDLSFNKIHVIEEGTFHPLRQLQSLKLANNSLVCDCSLRWLVKWVRENARVIQDHELLRCTHTAASRSEDSSSDLLHASLSSLLCADSYVSCTTETSGSRDTVLFFSMLSLDRHSKDSCHTLCFQKDHSHYGLDEEAHCLCGSLGTDRDWAAQMATTDEACTAVCSNTMQSSVCNRTVIHAVYPVKAALITSASRHTSVHQLINFMVETMLPAAVYHWDFGDGSGLLTTSMARVCHKYALPGIYRVTTHADVGTKTLRSLVMVLVSMPVALAELECPQVVETGHSIDVWIHIQQGSDLLVLWKMEASNGLQTLDETSCPRGGRVHPENLKCYWLVQTKESWKEAKQLCQATPGGDLAVVQSHDVQLFLQNAFSGAGSVWIGLGDPRSSGPLHMADRSPLDSFQSWGIPGHFDTDKDCVQLNTDLKGAWRSSPCQRKSSFLCEKRAGTALPNGEMFLTGLPAFTTAYDVKNATIVPVLPPLGSDTVELMLFPGLWFSHSGTLVSLEFGIQALKKPTQVRFQVFRPYCAPSQHLVPPGCELVRSPFASCQARPLCNTTGGCPSGQQWCPLRDMCLSVSSPCSSYAFENVTSNILPISNPPRFPGAIPSYSQVADVALLLGHWADSYDIQVLLSEKEITVYPDDIIGIQHTGGVGALLRCQHSPHSPWRQSYMSLRRNYWWESRVTGLTNPTWEDDVVCDLRVTSAYDLRSFAVTPLLSGQGEPGVYTYTAVIHNMVSSSQVSCAVDVQSRVEGLQIIHPVPISGKIHLPTQSRTMLVIKIVSGTNATVQWAAPVDQTGLGFKSSCPSSIQATVPGCRRDTKDSWFSFVWVFLADTQDETLNILVSNQISSQNLSVKIQSHNVITSLRVEPLGPRRMLVGVLQVFSASISQGTSVSYTWVVDDVESFAYIGPTYSLRLQKPGVYNLKLRAENPVSADTVELQLTADTMNQLHDGQILGLREVLPVNTSHTLTFGVKVDMSVQVTIRWHFGDDNAVLEDSWCPPYDPTQLQLDSRASIVGILSRVNHTYRQPGDYNLTVEAINKYDSLQQTISVRVLSPLTSLHLLTSPAAPLVNQAILFEARPYPSGFGLTFSWDFGDGSPERVAAPATIWHIFQKSGQYRVRVWAAHGLSKASSDMLVEVEQSVVGLQITCTGPSELGTATMINATVESGTDVQYSWNMGDGTVYQNWSLSYISHTFAREGNYTVIVIASNSATSTSSHISVEVYRFHIISILTPDVVASGEQVGFHAFVTGPVTRTCSHWDFGDDSPIVIIEQDPVVYHFYTRAGTFMLNLTVFGIASVDSFQSVVNVESRILSLNVTVSVQITALGDPVSFSASLIPAPDISHRYWYSWDFGTGEPPLASSFPESTFIYTEEGIYYVTVTARNKLGAANASVQVKVESPIGPITIHHSGKTGQALALNSIYCFTAMVSSGIATTLTWNFGDFSLKQQGSSICHSYNQAGNTTVSVIGENPISSQIATLHITVLTPVTSLSMLADSTFGEVGQVVVFRALLLAGDSVRYLWAVCSSCSFKEGSSTLEHAFLVPGTATVQVQVVNAVSVGEAKVSIEIQEKIQGIRIHSKDVLCRRYVAASEPFTLTVDIERGSNVTFRWDIFHGSSQLFSAKGKSVTFSSNAIGNLLVQMWAGNNLGQVVESTELQVMDRIRGVMVKALTKSVAVGTSVIFSVLVSSGSDMLYTWYPGEGQKLLPCNHSSFTYVFLTPGLRVISVTVSNFLGSSNGSMELRVQVPVSGVEISVFGHLAPFFFRSNTTIQFQGSVVEGTDVLWEWHLQKKNETQLFHQQNASCFLEEPELYHLVLRAWNDISLDMVEQTLQVQQQISGLELKVDRRSACTGDVLNFSLQVLKGTNVSFVLNVTTLGLVFDVHDGKVPLTVSEPGHHLVLAMAYNQVSHQSASVLVRVLEKVKGLHLLDCCPPALDITKILAFRADVVAGEELGFIWTFHLPGHPDYSTTGPLVQYTPAGEGNLTLHVKARNPSCSASLTANITLLSPVSSATLSCNVTVAFVNQTVAFNADVDGGSDLNFHWFFGDSMGAFTHSSQTVFHRYMHSGYFSAEVSIYNEISQVVAQVSVKVQELACEWPHVQLVPAPSTIFRSRDSYFEANVNLRACTAYAAQYLWEVYHSPDCHGLRPANQVPLGHVDVTTPLLVLPKRSLQAGMYCIHFLLSLKGTPLSHSVSLRLRVLQSELVAVIRGGSHRSWSADTDLLMDGSGSYDPDADLAYEDTSLEYQWHCELKNPSDPCTHRSFPLMSDANITIPSTTLCADTAYLFTLTVRKTGRKPASATQTVWIQPGEVLPVTLECRSCSALSSYQVSKSVHVTLSAMCENCHNTTQYKWTAKSSHGQLLNLDNATTSTGDANRDLVIRQGVLQDGINYTFTVTAFQPDSHIWGGSSITLTPNNPPTGGSCCFHPEKDIFLLETMVSYNCSGWTDEDNRMEQLIYTLVAETCTTEGRHCQQFYLYRGTKSSFSTLLPAGPDTTNSTVIVYLELEDSQGAKTMALNRTLTVIMPPVSGFQTVTGWLKNKSQSELWGLVQQGNPQDVIPYSLALVSILNQNVESGGTSHNSDIEDRISIRSNITEALTSLKISSMKDVTQLSAAISQCVTVPEELTHRSRARVLEAAQRMIHVISNETEEGHETPVHAGRNILGILGQTLSALDIGHNDPMICSDGGVCGAAVSAFNLTQALVKSLMKSRVLNEETLSLTTSEINVQGKRAASRDLLCMHPSERCLFLLPDAFAAQLAGSGELVQVMIDYDFKLHPFHPVTNTSISTHLASLEFSTPSGATVPVSNLSEEAAILVRLPTGNNTHMNNSELVLLIPAGESVNFSVTADPGSSNARVHIHIHITLPVGFDHTHESNPSISIYGRNASLTSEFSPQWRRKVIFSRGEGGFTRELTVLISPTPSFKGFSFDHHINVFSHYLAAPAKATVTLFSSLCQYFHFPSQSWRTDGVTSTDATTHSEVMCRTEHLTLFGASLFVPLNSVVFLPPSAVSRQSHLVLITCAAFFSIYLVLVFISHKLDDIDITRVGIMPLCGQPGRYKYWVIVKTGWKRGSGTTAHIGISLYGLNKSGSRHLDKAWAFQRNSQDIFQVETDANLGEIWKIRIWHDNTGLDPSWYLQHVIVWDRQTDVMYNFLVEDWLSVENEKNEGMVEKEVLAACPHELRTFSHIFPAQLRLGFSDWHLWWSAWGRPPHSRFTHVQRITCCMCTVYLFMATCVLWYGSMGVVGKSVPLGSRTPVTVESIAVGMVVAVVVLPVQLLFMFLFRQTHSKVVVEEPEPCTPDSQTIEMDVCLDISELGSSSFLSIPRGMESMMDVSSLSGGSFLSRKRICSPDNTINLDNESYMKQWPSCDSMFDIPDLLNSDPLLTRSRILKRKKALLTLGIEPPSSSDDDPMSFSDSSRKSSYDHLSLSEEDILNSIVKDAPKSEGSDHVTSDSGRFSPRVEADLISDILESRCSSWSDAAKEQGRSSWSFLRKSFSYTSMLTSMGSFLLADVEAPSVASTSFSTRIGVPRGRPTWLFPPWMLSVTYTMLFLCVALCMSILVLYGSVLNERAVLMWFISSAIAVLTSFFLLEPLKVVLEALRAALLTKPVHSEAEGLVEKPHIRKMPERVGKVRAPCGYGLLQAKEEARKVRALRKLMKSCLLHMLFVLVVLILNYQSCFHDNNIRLLHTAVKQAITVERQNSMNFTAIQCSADFWHWIDSVLLPHLHEDTRSNLVGALRLRQVCTAPDMASVRAFPAVTSVIFPSSTDCNRSHFHSSTEAFHIGLSEDPCSSFIPTNSSKDPIRLWFFGHLGIYGSNEGSWQELGTSLSEAQKTLRELQDIKWISKRSKAVFVELTQYHPDVDLYVAISLLTEFPLIGLAAHSTTIIPFRLPQHNSTLDLPLAMMALLFLFTVGFLVPDLLAICSSSGCGWWQGRLWVQLLLVLLSVGVGTTHFVCTWLTGVKLEHYRNNRHTFLSLYEVALLTKTETCLSALLLLITMLKIVRQMRFIRRWAFFGKILHLAFGELLTTISVLVLLLLVYAQCGYLLFSGTAHEFRTFRMAFFTLLSVLHGRTSIQPLCKSSPVTGGAFVLSYLICILGIGSWLLYAVILQGYRRARADIYQPTAERQDYEMIEFCLKRFKLWLGLSKAKEFRHKVKFEGMESLPSRSSQRSKRSPLPVAGTTFKSCSSSISSGSFHSEELALSDSPAPDLCTSAMYLERLPSTVNNLLDQFDRINQVLEDVCRLESSLEEAQRRMNTSRKARKEKEQLQAKKKDTNKPVKQLDLPRTYSTFSESALARLRSSRVKVCTIDGNKLFQHPLAADALGTHRSWLGGAPASYDLCLRLGQGSGVPWKWRPKSEEGQGGMCRDFVQQNVPQKRRAWQTDGHSEM